MITLVQFPWSPFCIIQRRILEYANVPFKVINIPVNDRSLVWRWTKQRYYAVPILRDGKTVVFETDEDSQVIAKYVDAKFTLELFPPQWAGLQHLIWRHMESEIEGLGFKLNDIHYEEMVPKSDRLLFLRHKERKFGRGCIDLWRQQQPALLTELAARLSPYEQMLSQRPYLLDQQPRFLDFDLFGMLGNFLYSGHYALPKAHVHLQAWHHRMQKVRRTRP
jgi:glutathione S-transferase